jgi:uncharacterized protein
MTFKLLLATGTFFLFFCFCHAQKNPQIINSADIIKTGVKFYDDAKYDDAAAQYELVGRNDTNYAIALYEKGLCYYRLGKYDTVMRIAQQLIDMDSYTSTDAYTLMGNALDEKKKTDDAIAFYHSAIQKFPRAYLLQFNLGVALYKAKRADEAYAAFKYALQLNPRHPTSHYFLGLILADNKRWAPALLAMQTAMLLQPNKTVASNCLTQLLNIAKGDYTVDVGGGKLSEDEDPTFAKIDKLIESQVAFNKGYEIATKIDDKLMKQTQFTLENMKQSPPASKNYFVEQYVDLYLQMLQPQWLKTFLYYPYKDLDNEVVNKWKAKNKKELAEFEKWVDDYFAAIAIKYTDTVNGKPVEVKRFYYSNGYVEAIGGDYDSKARIRKGHWKIFHTNTLLQLEGDYDSQGKMQGEWKTYYASGKLQSVSTYLNDKREGEFKSYYPNGNIKKIAVFKNDLYDGNVKEYYNSGAIKTDIDYKNGEADGSYKTFHFNGNPNLVVGAKGDKMDGIRSEYAAPGYLLNTVGTKNGQQDGEYYAYYPSGKVKYKGTLKAGKEEGPWVHYFENGKIQKEYGYTAGILTGEMKQYYPNGKLNLDDFYDAKGKQTGTSVYYDQDGIKYFEGVYKDDKLVAYKYFDKAGKVIHESAENHNDLLLKVYTPDGKLLKEGNFKKGDYDGAWTVNYRCGTARIKETYANGKENGPFQEFYKSGKLHKQGTYKDGRLDGYYTQYFTNGKLEEELNFVKGQKEGDGYTYFADGSVCWHVYYYHDDESGWQTNYYPDGRINYEYYMDGNILSKYLVHDTSGAVISKFLNPAGTKEFSLNYFNGKPYKTGKYVNGDFDGSYKIYYSNGQLQTDYNYVRGYRQGPDIEFHMNGKLSKTGFYKNGNSDSVWVFYDKDGVADVKGNYKEDERDGYWAWLYPNGKPEYTVKYNEGDKDSTATLYAPDGTVRIKFKFRYGTLSAYSYLGKDDKEMADIDIPNETSKIVAYYPNGNKSYEGNYVNGLLNGKLIYYYPDGKVQQEEMYSNGDENGKQLYYYPDGRVQKEENKADDELSGPRKLYDKTGNLVLEENYYLGELHGKVKEYETGKLKHESVYYYGVELR